MVPGMTKPQIDSGTDPGPVPPDTDTIHTRAHIIAAIHAYADLLAAHPEIPAPQSLIALTTITAADEIDEALRVAPVLAYGRGHTDAHLREDTYHVSALHVIAERCHVGVRISVHYKAELDSYNHAGRYVR